MLENRSIRKFLGFIPWGDKNISYTLLGAGMHLGKRRRIWQMRGRSFFRLPKLNPTIPLHWYPIFAQRITYAGGDRNGFGKDMFATYLNSV